jgi:hypothetical protein
VDQLHHSREANGARPLITAVPRGKQQKRGAQALSASAQEVLGDFRDGLKRSAALPVKLLLDQREVLADNLE